MSRKFDKHDIEAYSPKARPVDSDSGYWLTSLEVLAKHGGKGIVVVPISRKWRTGDQLLAQGMSVTQTVYINEATNV